MNNLSVWAPRVLSILRIAAALTFMSHGTMKLFDFPGPQEGAPDPLPTMLLAAAWLEVVGGALLAVGLFTRPVAFILSGQMAVAFFMAHAAPGGIVPAINKGEAAYLFTFIFFYLVFAGPGPWSLDAMLGKKA